MQRSCTFMDGQGGKVIVHALSGMDRRQCNAHAPSGMDKEAMQRSCTFMDGQEGKVIVYALSGMDKKAMQSLMHPQGWTQRQWNRSNEE